MRFCFCVFFSDELLFEMVKPAVGEDQDLVSSTFADLRLQDSKVCKVVTE